MYWDENRVRELNKFEPQIAAEINPGRGWPAGERSKGIRPVILCEYAHAMGNSLGNFKDYWDLFREPEMKSLQGGFVWDWIDQGLYTKSGTWGYGGDFDELRHDKQFCINGIVWPDRTPHPCAYECKSVQAPVSCSVIDYSNIDDECSVLLEVENRHDYIGLDHLIMTWHVEIDGKVIGGFRKLYKLKSFEPRSSQKIVLSWDSTNEGMEDMYMIVRFETAENTAWASAGHVITEVSLRVPVNNSRPPDVESKTLDKEALRVSENKNRVVVGTSNYEAEFLKQTGQLVTLRVRDDSGSLTDLIDDDSFAFRMNLWRAPTDNDLGDTWVQLDEDVVPTHVKILAKTLKSVGFTPGGT